MIVSAEKSQACRLPENSSKVTKGIAVKDQCFMVAPLFFPIAEAYQVTRRLSIHRRKRVLAIRKIRLIEI
jgi:hypothetical protein